MCLFHIQQIGIDRLEQCRIQLHRLKDHLAIRQQTGTDYLDPRQGRRSVENPKRGVIEVAACDEPFVGLVDWRQRMGRRSQKLQLCVALADLIQPGAEAGDGFVMRVQQPPFRQQRVHEGIADGALNRLPELRPRHQERVDVHSTGVERDAGLVHLLVVDGHERQVDVRLFPDGIVRKAAAENGRQDRTVPFHLRDKFIERLSESLLDGPCQSSHRSRASCGVSNSAPTSLS